MTNALTLSSFDLPTLHRYAIGFDRVFEDLNRTFANSRQDGAYPPYNIAKLDETHYVVELAVAGFSESELDIELKENVLTVRGNKVEKTGEPEYLHRGIGSRNFTRTFTLADNMKVCGATVTNGILAIALEQVVPEEQKPKKISITFQR
jgi:molecular chaperone IbpA